MNKELIKQGICPYCNKTLYIADINKERTVLECWSDNKRFLVNELTKEVIEKCDKAYFQIT